MSITFVNQHAVSGCDAAVEPLHFVSSSTDGTIVVSSMENSVVVFVALAVARSLSKFEDIAEDMMWDPEGHTTCEGSGSDPTTGSSSANSSDWEEPEHEGIFDVRPLDPEHDEGIITDFGFIISF